MKLNKFSQYYNEFFKHFRKSTITPKFNTRHARNLLTEKTRKVYVLTKLHKKLLHKYGIPEKSVSSTRNYDPINVRPDMNLRLDIDLLINGNVVGCITNGATTHRPVLIYQCPHDEFMLRRTNNEHCIVVQFSDFREYNINDRTHLHAADSQYSKDIIDYETQDEAKIFQYNTMFDYDTFRAMLELERAITKYREEYQKLTSTAFYHIVQSIKGVSIIS